MNGELSALRDLVDVLREQLGKAEADRARLLDLVLADRIAVNAAERRADKAEALLAGGLTEVRAMVAVLTAQGGEQMRTSDLQSEAESRRATRPRRRGLLARLFGQGTRR